MHKNNKHQKGYDFKVLTQSVPELKPFVFENEYGTQTIDFANPKTVKLLNKALLKTYYSIDYWEFPDKNLCPPIPGRVDYIHHLADLLKSSKLKNSRALEVGTGATCIYPLLGYSECKWDFIASDIDTNVLKNAQTIIDKNNLTAHIKLRLQPNKTQVLKGIIEPSDRFGVSMCNPPFYKNEQDALQSTIRKLSGLGKEQTQTIRNFSGTAQELWYEGGEKAFLHTYLYESSLYKDNCHWYTSLVSNKDLLKTMQKSLKKLGATEVKVINMQLGNKISRVVAWTFLTQEQQKDWLT
ncbi:MAG: 23S rRNA (adenine1618-N6)-methyltransferase [Glaciecola sp.]